MRVGPRPWFELRSRRTGSQVCVMAPHGAGGATAVMPTTLMA